MHHLLEKQPPPARAAPSARTRDSRADASGRALVCIACRHRITGTADRVDVAGAHEHVFMNPGGFVFTIGCFSAAPGCAPVGPPSEEWSWFPGHAWTTCVCAGCATHLGWAFSARGAGTRFHGLILDRLCESDDEEG